MTRFCILFILLFAAIASHAADSEAMTACMREVTGVDDVVPFQRFDRDFRAALDRHDATAIALLAQFPLRVNFVDGSVIQLADAGTLQTQYDRVFTPALRDAVRNQAADDLVCKYSDGIGYANGTVWIHPAGADDKQLRIVAVNVPGGVHPPRKTGAIGIACSTPQFRVVVDATNKPDLWRYRVWNLPRALSEKPDLELTGTRDIQGTSPCTHASWQFKNANATYTINDPNGCGPDAPPKNATGSITVTVGDETKLEAWCF